MGFKNTFEIITKDIQDIEKLVGNFKNYSEIPNIELDLALSKLRNVYDILLLIKDENQKNSLKSNSESKIREEAEPEQIVDQEKINLEEELIQLDNYSCQTEKETSLDQELSQKPEKTITDKFESEKGFVNERLSSEKNKNDLSSRLQSSPIQSIAGSIGINDKFLFIRELFNGDAEIFRSTLETLDHSPNLESALNYLRINFTWPMEDDTVKQLITLIKRKFISSKNV
jgi:hypothetical protein